MKRSILPLSHVVTLAAVLVGFTPLALAASATTLEKHPARAPITLEFRVAEPVGSSETTELPLQGTRESLHLRKQVVLTVKDLRGAEAVKDGAGQEQVLLLIKADAAQRLGKVTGDNLGRRLGVVVDGKLLLAPEIKMKITTDKMFLGVDMKPGEAKRLAARITAAANH